MFHKLVIMLTNLIQKEKQMQNNIQLSDPLILYHCGHEECKPSHSFGPAIRPHYLIHYVLNGQGQYRVNGATYNLKKGDAFLITPGVTTLYQADEYDPWEYCWFGFDGYDVQTMLKNCGFSRDNLTFTDNNNGVLKNQLKLLLKSFTEGQGNEYSYLGHLYLCFSYMRSTSVVSQNLIYDTHVVKALNYIHHNYSYDIKVNDVAKYVSIDRTYLYKLFMLYKKISPQQYLITYRVNIACKLLNETDFTVTEIAFSCGFKDAPSFNKHFRKHFNMTPLQYRSDVSQYLG